LLELEHIDSAINEFSFAGLDAITVVVRILRVSNIAKVAEKKRRVLSDRVFVLLIVASLEFYFIPFFHKAFMGGFINIYLF